MVLGMCVLFIAWQVHPRYRLIVAGNRDEHRARPTAALARWAERADVVGGRDLVAGGSWLAASRSGRFAAVTNFRELPLSPRPRSRGILVSDFVCGEESPADFASRLSLAAQDYAGTNLFVADAKELWHWSNRGAVTSALKPGLYGLSNGMLADDWPKMRRGREALAKLVSASDNVVDNLALFALLGDRTLGDDHELPNTGVGRELERTLSPIFIAGSEYGTRASTVLLIEHTGGVRMLEKSWGPGGSFEGEAAVTL